MFYAAFGAALVPTGLSCLTLQRTLFIFLFIIASRNSALHFDVVSFNGREAVLITFAHRSRVFHSVTASCLLIVPAMLVWEENVLIKSSFLLFQETYRMNIK